MLRALAIATLTVLLAACAETPQRPEPAPAPVVYAPADSGPTLARDASNRQQIAQTCTRFYTGKGA